MSATAISDWPTPDRLDDDDVEAGRLASAIVSRVLRVTPPSVPEVGDGRMKAHRLLRQPAHARLVAEDRAARALRGRVDGEHGDPVAGGDEVHAELVDGRRLADARHAGDAEAQRAARRRQQRLQQLLGERGVLGLGALDERDGARQHRPVAGADAVGKVSSDSTRRCGEAIYGALQELPTESVFASPLGERT